MSNIIDVELGKEHLKRVSQVKPFEGMKQIIWNSIDADANNIIIKFYCENEIDTTKITRISVIDDGHGLNYNKIESAFKVFGKSDKTLSNTSPGGRHYHGKLGEGRYSYFSLGENVVWESIYSDDGNKKYNINFEDGVGKKVTFSNPQETIETTGLKVDIDFVKEEANEYLKNTKKLEDDIVKEFGGYLSAYKNISIYLNSKKIMIDNYIESIKVYENKLNEFDFHIKIVKWKDIKANDRYICGLDSVVFLEEPLDSSVNSVSLYLSSSFFDEKKKENSIDAWEASEIGGLIREFISNSLEDFIDSLKLNENEKFIQELMDSGAHPYSSEKLNIIEKEQKKIFDVIAIELYKKSPSSMGKTKASKKLTCNLLNEAIKTNPSSLKKILQEVFNLSKKEQDTFASILEKTSLSCMIETVNEVMDRLTFLDELNEIVYGESGKHVKERTQFQKLLLSQIWIFGDTYKYGTDDVTLRNVLKAYISELGLDDIELTEEDKVNTDFNKIPDIVLWNNQKTGDYFENLVVEIKRPHFTLTNKELDQIRNYAYKIIDDNRFNPENTKWRFILIGERFDKNVQHQLDGKKDGVLQEASNYRIEVLKWSNLVEKNKLRYNYFKEKIEFNIQQEDVVSSLSQRWQALLGEVPGENN